MFKTQLEQGLFLQNLSGVGPATHERIHKNFASFDVFFKASTAALSFLPAKAKQQIQDVKQRGESAFLTQKVRRDVLWLQHNQVNVVDSASTHYPNLLREIKRYPPLLYVWGDLTTLALPQIAIVGSRNPSEAGKRNARLFARELAENGFVVTSGLALGIDIEAHLGALEAGGKTLAVMGTGINKVYPQRHREFAEAIVSQGGAVISEFPLDTGAKPTSLGRPTHRAVADNALFLSVNLGNVC